MFKKINLQMFAEEPATEPTEPVTTEPATEPEKPAKTFTQEEVDRIVKGKKAEWEKKKAEEAKAKEEAEKVSKMDADQKHQYELEQKDKRIAELEKEAERVGLCKTATEILKKSDIEATDDVLTFVVGDDETATKANIEKFVKIIEAQVQKKEKARATGKTPAAFGNNGGSLSEIDKRIAKYQ